MKKYFFLVILTLFSMLIVGQDLKDDKRVIVYSTNPQYPPYDWSIGENLFDGASIELLQMVIPPGYKLKPVLYPWKRSMLLAEQGDIDLLVSLRITPEREKYLTFTKHRAFPNPIVVFARKDKTFKFETWNDLKQYTGGVSIGDTFGGGFDEYWPKELRIEQAANMEENFKKLDLGRIDYFVTGYYMGKSYIDSHKMDYPIITLGKPISTLDIHFGFSKNSLKTLPLDYVSQKLEELDKKGVPEKLLIKYLEKYKQNPTIYNLK